MASVDTKLITAEQFYDWANRPENRDKYCELERGEIVELSRPGKRHGLICAGVILNQAYGPTDLAQSTNETELRRLLAGINLVAIDETSEPDFAEVFGRSERQICSES